MTLLIVVFKKTYVFFSVSFSLHSICLAGVVNRNECFSLRETGPI